MKLNTRQKKLRNLVNTLLQGVVFLEEYKAIAVTRFYIELRPDGIKIKLRTVHDRHNDNAKNREDAKAWLKNVIAHFIRNFRFDHLNIECDLEHGAVSCRVQDFGPTTVCEELRECFARENLTSDIVTDGYLYSDPSTWKDAPVDPEHWKISAKAMCLKPLAWIENSPTLPED